MKIKKEKKMWEASQEEYDRAEILVDEIQTSLASFLARKSTREDLIWTLINLRRPCIFEAVIPKKRNTKRRDRSKLLFIFKELVTELFEEKYGKEGIDDG